ncbi:hypothetical protein PV08_07056 [Exophiala spinifera]|uniref:Xylanolytic transcriptional activator regulatory domain-containing protein n=1 Tax=Exophiala spinifera TaxID=91928 RepID=A0A0D2BSM2_9EURO|nr:uncharacterized protein PV08_07056 [Exophiala spinifera]KIW14274.1 hypothetical protein PV08_07056 [Exophiala spinifera]
MRQALHPREEEALSPHGSGTRVCKHPDVLPPVRDESAVGGNVSYERVENPGEQPLADGPPNGSLADSVTPNVPVAVAGSPTWPDPAPPLSVQNPAAYSDSYFRDPGFSVDFNQQVLYMNWWSPSIDDVADWQIQQELVSTNIFPSFDASILCTEVNMPNSATTQTGGIPPAQENELMEIPSAVMRETDMHGSPHTELQSSMAQSDKTGSSSGSTVGRYYVDGVVARAALPGRFHAQPSIASPSSESINSASMASANPPSAASISFVSPTSYRTVRENLLSETPPRSRESVLSWFPTLHELSWHVQTYFDRFHSTMPFLRKATFQSAEPHWLLTLAVATVGAQYTAPESTKPMRNVLHEALQQHLNAAHRHNDVTPGPSDLPSHSGRISYLDLQVLQAAILNTLLLLHSGVQEKINSALLEKSRLVEMCDTKNLFRLACEPKRSTSNVGRDIRDWLERQALLRTGMMIWLLDAIFSYEVNSQPRMAFPPPDTPLSCSERTWEMPSEESIASETSNSLLFSHALEMLYMEKRLPKNLGDFAHVLLIHAICRRTKDVFSQAQSRLSFWTPSAAVQTRIPALATGDTCPPSNEMSLKWRNSACDCLDILHWQANGRIAESAGWEHPTVLHLHLARLLILTPTVHLQTLAANPMLLGNPDVAETPFNASRKHLINWATHDQYKARLAVIHAGALCWHIRRYSVDNVLEPFAVYMATLVIWAYSVVLVSTKISNNRQGNISNPDSMPGSQRLSGMPMQTASSTNETEIDPSMLYVDRPCDDEMVQNFARMGHKMTARMRGIPDISAPEAPKKILQEGICLLRSATGNPEARWNKFSPSRQELSPEIWGVQKQYLESLSWLESKSE